MTMSEDPVEDRRHQSPRRIARVNDTPFRRTKMGTARRGNKPYISRKGEPGRIVRGATRTICAGMLLKKLAVFAPLAFASLAMGPTAAVSQKAQPYQRLIEQGDRLAGLQGVIVQRDGRPAFEHVFAGPPLDRTVNIKSASKSVMSALAGIAVDRGILSGADQAIAPVLKASLPTNPDPRLDRITVEDLLTMRAGLERTSGANYGGWISSRNWVRDALSRPFVDEPGGRMLYSTGSTHLLSAVLTRASRRSTLALAREWLAEPLGISIPSWDRDPQGIYLGGNNMAMSPRGLVAFGEMYRNGGMVDGRRVLSEDWIRRSWTPVTNSMFTGHGYGYGWFVTDFAGHRVNYAWGYGGQMLYVLPSLALTVVMTSQSDAARDGGHLDALHRLLAEGIVPAAETGA
jgi:CubicO group peptidase (beta-lactamase class C family)